MIATLVSFVMVFFAIWWAWMNFTWFASSYDTDDIPYRLLVFVQMTGALILASGVEAFFTNQDLTIPVLGYIVMRAASTVQWLRAARADPEHRPAALRYAGGTVIAQAAWVMLLFAPEALRIPGFFALVLAELLIPVWAESPHRPPGTPITLPSATASLPFLSSVKPFYPPAPRFEPPLTKLA